MADALPLRAALMSALMSAHTRQSPPAAWAPPAGENAPAWRSDTLHFIGQLALATVDAVRGRARWRRADLLQQLTDAGPRSLPVVAVVSAMVGPILAYMGAAQLQRFGAEAYIAELVTVGAVREIGALMTGVLLAGRVGAAHAAELASMRLNDEIDALRVLGLSPSSYLVFPRVLAMLPLAPLLTALAAATAIAAGGAVSFWAFDLPWSQFMTRSFEALTPAHVAVGLVKGTVYAMLAVLAGCRQGLYAQRSAPGVGHAATRAVVQGVVWIVAAASLLTVAFQRWGW